jgi:branched-chain amino acid transport system substrate-binding protein
MTISRRTLLGSAAATAALPLASRRARAADTIKIGVLNDMSGPYKDTGGPSSVAAVKLAVSEFASKGFNVEVINADHQNKPDLGASIARQWYDRDNVDLVMDVPTSSVGLAVGAVAKEKNKLYINVGSASVELTNSGCSPSLIHYIYDTYMLAKSTGGATVKAGGDSWFFITADYAFGKQLQSDTTAMVQAAGGTVKGSVAYPFPGTTDFSSFLVQAQSSGAKVLGLSNAGADTVNSIKQAAEFGVNKTMKIAPLLMFITDVHALGLDVAAGLVMTESFYWDMNDKTRAFTKRFLPHSPKNYPNMIHAGNYSATLHFLKAVTEMGIPAAKKNGTDIANQMKKMPVSDDCFQGSIRADGRGMFPAYLFGVKTKAESKGEWDLFKLLQTTPAEEAYKPLSQSTCYYIKKS